MDPTQWNTPFWVTVVALFVIVMLRANGTYWLGRATANGLARTRVRRLMESRGYARAHENLDRWGAPVVALSFLTVGFQTLMNLAAGAGRMSLRSYLPAVVVGSTMWAFLYAFIGTAGVSAFVTLYERSPVTALVVLGAVAVALGAFVVRRVRSAA